MNLSKIVTNAMLLTTALCWGIGYSIRKMALAYTGPFFFNSLRFFVGFLFVLSINLLITLYNKKRQKVAALTDDKTSYKPIFYQILGGLAAGAVLSIAASLQQLALSFTSAGKTGFITSLYTIFVPIISFFFLKKKVRRQVWFGAILAVIGLFLISLDGKFIIAVEDIVLVIAAIFYALQIFVIDHFIKYSSGMVLSTAQLFSGAVICLFLSFIFEKGNNLNGILNLNAAILIICAGVISIGVAQTLQIIAQKKAAPSVASIIFSFESVFGAIFGAIILKESMTSSQILGCILIFIAVITSQYEKSTLPSISMHD
jgi:drug/metabolite transporter (DMT)-like permease